MFKVVVLFCAINFGVEDTNNCIKLPQEVELYEDKTECTDRALEVFTEVYNNPAYRVNITIELGMPQNVMYRYGCITNEPEGEDI